MSRSYRAQAAAGWIALAAVVGVVLVIFGAGVLTGVALS